MNIVRRSGGGGSDDADGRATEDEQRRLIAQSFTKIAEAQDDLASGDLQFVGYLLDMAKLELAMRADRLIGASRFLHKQEEAMMNWFRSKVAEDTGTPGSRPEPN